jgi:hypothetical protein
MVEDPFGAVHKTFVADKVEPVDHTQSAQASSLASALASRAGDLGLDRGHKNLTSAGSWDMASYTSGQTMASPMRIVEHCLMVAADLEIAVVVAVRAHR